MKENIRINQGSVAGKYLTFALSQERYGFEILKVQEIIGVPKITPVPRAPSFIKGVINLRGKIIPVVDLRLKCGLDPAPYDEKTCIIVVSIAKADQSIVVGVVVDTVLEVVDFSAAQIEPTPQYGSHLESSGVVGIGKREEAVTMLLDIQQVLGSEGFETTGLEQVSAA